MSRVRQFSIPRDEEGGYGLTFRGSSPVFVRSVDYPSSARTAGIRSGDLLLEVNSENVRYMVYIISNKYYRYCFVSVPLSVSVV